jgi:hypothetical protein
MVGPVRDDPANWIRAARRRKGDRPGLPDRHIGDVATDEELRHEHHGERYAG